MKGLSPRERELLTMLAEEAGEIVQAVTKILRHGPASWSPLDETRTPNSAALRREIRDIRAVLRIMAESYDRPLLAYLGAEPSPAQLGVAMRRKQSWMHHIQEPDQQ